MSSGGRLVIMSIGEELLEERRRRRRAGDSRFTEADGEYARRLTTGDLVDEFQAVLDAVNAADPCSAATPTPIRATDLSTAVQ